MQEADEQRRQVVVLDRHGRPRSHPLWQGNPRILRPEQFIAHQKKNYIYLTSGAGCRAYADYDRMKREFAAVFPGQKYNPRVVDRRLPWRFTDHKCTRGELYCIEPLSPQGYVVIEPHVKAIQHNRKWGWERWQAVVDALPGLDWVQINPPGERLLRGVRSLPAASFLEACRRISGAAAYVGPEGGLYHAAAVFHVPAVAIFGGYISPANQGYDDCINLYEPAGSPCGQRVPCDHCAEALARITPEQVAHHVSRVMEKVK